MSTLADMKATIASEIMRDDLTDAIAGEITKAIRFYKSKRFFFNEKMTSITLTTTDGQSVYGQPPADFPTNLTLASSYLPDVIRIDSLVGIDTGSVRVVSPVDELNIKILTSEQICYGMPRYYSYYGRFLTLWPVPNGTFTLYLTGLIRLGAPATDDEEDNPWMNEAEELIRSRAKRNIFAHWMEDDESAQRMSVAEDEALQSLYAETSARTQVSQIVPECL